MTGYVTQPYLMSLSLSKNRLKEKGLSMKIGMERYVIECNLVKIKFKKAYRENGKLHIELSCKMRLLMLKKGKFKKQYENLQLVMSLDPAVTVKKIGGIRGYICPYCGSSLDLFRGGKCDYFGYQLDFAVNREKMAESGIIIRTSKIKSNHHQNRR